MATVFKKTKRVTRNAAVAHKPGTKKLIKTKITGSPVKKKKKPVYGMAIKK